MMLAILILLTLATTCQAGPLRERLQGRFVARAETVIQRVGIPADANGMAMTRQVRLNCIPIIPIAPFGAHVIFGRGVAFQVDANRQLVEPRLTKIRGGGVSASIGAGVPFSLSVNREVRALYGADYQRFSSERFSQASVKVFAAAGVPGKFVAVARGPDFGRAIPGKVVAKRSLFIGLFASTGVEVSIKTMRPVRRR